MPFYRDHVYPHLVTMLGNPPPIQKIRQRIVPLAQGKVLEIGVGPGVRTAYVRQVAHAVKPGGHVIVSTFGPEGPTKCSGLDVVRYDAESLHKEFGVHFHLLNHSEELHRTPFGTVQQCLYCLCRVE